MNGPLNQTSRVRAAAGLFDRDLSLRQKLEALRGLVRHANPKLDRLLDLCSQSLERLEKFQKGQLLESAGESLPETTAEEKKRKEKALLWLRCWRQFERGEVVEASCQLLPEETPEEKEHKKSLLLFVRT